MKAVHVTLDEKLLAELDADDEVQGVGPSAVLRRAVADYLRRRRSTVADQHRRAYSDHVGLDREFEGWEEEGEWPTERIGAKSGSSQPQGRQL